MSEEINSQDKTEMIVQHQEVFAGPLPHPKILKAYDEIFPGAAKIIIEMANRQATHRQELEKKVINSDVCNSKLGLWFGFIIGITGIILGAFIVYMGQVIAGSVISFGTLVSLVGVFVYGSQGRRKEREQKNK